MYPPDDNTCGKYYQIIKEIQDLVALKVTVQEIQENFQELNATVRSKKQLK